MSLIRNLHHLKTIRRHISTDPYRINEGVSVYVHWPYCKKLCSYCNFNKYVKLNVDQQRMVDCLITEWDTLSSNYDIHAPVTIFFGGGTPSLIDARLIENIVSHLSKNSRSASNIEISLEGNPGDLVGRIQDLKEAGVTRLSIGVQALNDDELKFLNRDHDADQARMSIEESLLVFPDTTSVDLIFGRPRQTWENFRQELEQIINWKIPHVSLYQLTVERGTSLHKQVAVGQVEMPDEEIIATMYTGAVLTLVSAGLRRYEVSNFSIPGGECVHNQGYWSGRQYLGLGPGAHSRIGEPQNRHALVNIPSPDIWMSEVERIGHGVRLTKSVAIVDSLKELIATGLRREKGISVNDWDRVSCGRVNLSQLFNRCHGSQTGIIFSDGHLKLASEQICILDSIIPDLFNTLDTLVS